jgi:hypothetical protein
MPIISSSFNVTGFATACSQGTRAIGVPYKFEIGSLVFSVAKAKKGILQASVIKQIKVVFNARTQGRYLILYTDTFNVLWNEDELCSEADATTFAIAYLENEQQQILQTLGNCGII